MNWKNTLYPHNKKMYDFDRMMLFARSLKYPYFWWEGFTYNTIAGEEVDNDI